MLGGAKTENNFLFLKSLQAEENSALKMCEF